MFRSMTLHKYYRLIGFYLGYYIKLREKEIDDILKFNLYHIMLIIESKYIAISIKYMSNIKYIKILFTYKLI